MTRRSTLSLSAIIAIVAGGNIAGCAALVAVWWLRRHGFMASTPYPSLFALLVSSTVSDVAMRIWHGRRPDSRVREQVRIAVGAATTTSIVYATGWGSLFAIGYALCGVQLFAHLRRASWFETYLWCAGGVIIGEAAVQVGIAPSILPVAESHVIALVGLGALIIVLWIVGGAFAAREASEQQLRVREQLLQHEAATDALTNLANRSALIRALEQRVASHLPSTLFLIDFDNFKDVNDTFGHEIGDAVLIEAAARMRAVVDDDLIARMGGDEFVILVGSALDKGGQREYVERIQRTIEEPWPQVAPSQITASIGVVADDSGRSADDLLREADEKMYAGKHGMTSGSMTTMTSRALTHHRLAMDGMRGGFTVARAIRDREQIVDWVVVEANALVRESFRAFTGEVVGERLSVLNEYIDNSQYGEMGAEALSTATTVTAEISRTLPDGRVVWRNAAAIPVDRDVIAIVAADITTEVEARVALERERARFAALAAGSSDLACVVDERGYITYAPDWATTFLGYSAEDLRTPLTAVAPGDRTHAFEWFDAAVAAASGSSIASCTLRFIARDGSVHTFEVSAQNRCADPMIEGIVLTAHDVSDVVAAEARLGAIAESVTDVIAICSEVGLLTWASGAVREVLGMTPDAVVGLSAFSLIHPDDHERVARRLIQVVEDRDTEPMPLEMRLRRSDGTYRWFEVNGNNRLDDPSIRGIVVSLRDTTERRAVEEALRVSEERNRTIVEAAGDAIITVESGLIATFNRAAEYVFGVRGIDVIGTSFTRFIPADSLMQLRSSVEDGALGQQLDVVATRASGEEFYAEVTISKVQVGDHFLFTAVLRDVSDQREMQNALRTAALRDDLTGLPNRRMLLDRTEAAIESAAASGEVVGMVFVDLDRFKLVNDGLGHDVGDQLLVLVAERIASVVRTGDLIARLGGDEFAVLCPNAGSVDAVTAAAARIVKALEQPFAIRGNHMFVGASIGVSVWQGTETPLDLLRFADVAMYRAKNQKSRVELFDDEMQREIASRLDLESALRVAIANNELVAHYQPIVNLRTGDFTELEALVRWEREGIGLVRPDEFISVAEETGLIGEVGEWMLRRATADCAAWQGIARDVGVSVNVSARQFENDELDLVIARALEDSGLAPRLLTLEITESVMLQHTDRNILMMQRIRNLGVRIALDDFGSGYSSLTYVRRLPIDAIKIDRSFLQTIQKGSADLVMLQTIVDLGAAHRLRVVAEGVDSHEKLDALRAVGCEYAQGFLFSEPRPVEEVLVVLAMGRAVQPSRR